MVHSGAYATAVAFEERFELTILILEGVDGLIRKGHICGLARPENVEVHSQSTQLETMSQKPLE